MQLFGDGKTAALCDKCNKYTFLGIKFLCIVDDDGKHPYICEPCLAEFIFGKSYRYVYEAIPPMTKGEYSEFREKMGFWRRVLP